MIREKNKEWRGIGTKKRKISGKKKDQNPNCVWISLGGKRHSQCYLLKIKIKKHIIWHSVSLVEMKIPHTKSVTDAYMSSHSTVPDIMLSTPLHSTRQSTDQTIALSTTFHCPRNFIDHDINSISTKFHCPRHSIPFLGIICGSFLVGIICDSGIICGAVQDTHRPLTTE